MVGLDCWRLFSDEIARWSDAGRRVEFWWRDDDASSRAPALNRLLDLAAQTNVPLALAVIPGRAEHALLEGAATGVSALQHGVDHRNRAAKDGKKTEFPHEEAVDSVLSRLRIGRAQLEAVAGDRALAVLVPPWNRFPAALVPYLGELGYRGLSTYGARKSAEPAPGLRQVNTHVDVINWKSGRCFAGEEHVLGQAVRHLKSRRIGEADPGEPTGWLTHHAVHDEAAWRFLARLFEVTRSAGAVTWLRPATVFACEGEK